ncbi:unnamed protein product [Gongylonema pulchrum]|uniref:Uncharacterized protein n=1 Tax=Gongylonema pulchrum TaxID=637853 RepID=A0A183CZE7_9BILA|nr:unnamed protein product [Gongylonema pulchrum]
MNTFKLFLLKFEPVARLLIIRKLISMIMKNEIQKLEFSAVNSTEPNALNFEPQLFAWLIDLYRSNLNHDEFRRELGFLWGDLSTIRYSRLADALQYFISVFVLAQDQALRKFNPHLMLNIYHHYLLPMKVQISDWSTLVNAQAKHENDASLATPAEKLAENMENLDAEARRQQDLQSLPLLQFQFTQTLQFAEGFLRENGLL